MLSFLPGQLMRYRSVLDHRNGLLLYENSQGMYVCNPATRRWATLSEPPRTETSYSHLFFYRHRMYLMFDPTMSLHYNVLFFPDVPEKPKPPHLQPGESQISRADYEHERNSLGSMEWPPYIYPLQVFSSKTGRWEEKQFIREGDAAVTVSDVWLDALAPSSSRNSLQRHAVHWRASFYVHCDSGFIMRLSLEKQNYLVIKTPKLDTTGLGVDATGRETHLTTYGYLGKSKHGVYYTTLCGYTLQVWVLCKTLESCQTPEWELKHQANLTNLNLHHDQHLRGERYEKCWILNGRSEESEHGWDSTDDSAIDLEGGSDMDYKDYHFAVDFLGYHPYKEIAFLGNRFQGFAYYLENSKLKYLGSPYPPYLGNRDYGLRPILESFIYTPCMDDLLPIQNDAMMS